MAHFDFSRKNWSRQMGVGEMVPTSLCCSHINKYISKRAWYKLLATYILVTPGKLVESSHLRIGKRAWYKLLITYYYSYTREVSRKFPSLHSTHRNHVLAFPLHPMPKSITFLTCSRRSSWISQGVITRTMLAGTAVRLRGNKGGRGWEGMGRWKNGRMWIIMMGMNHIRSRRAMPPPCLLWSSWCPW